MVKVHLSAVGFVPYIGYLGYPKAKSLFFKDAGPNALKDK